MCLNIILFFLKKNELRQGQIRKKDKQYKSTIHKNNFIALMEINKCWAGKCFPVICSWVYDWINAYPNPMIKKINYLFKYHIFKSKYFKFTWSLFYPYNISQINILNLHGLYFTHMIFI
jgi:hypothetical protein